jgi:steroid 5-alpha reductase family enzyme
MMGSEGGMIESDPLPLVMTTYFAMVFVMVGLWVVQRRIRNAAIGDVGWCVGLIGSVLWYATQAPVNVERILLTVMLVTLYAGR